jgi:hypothetical protein
MNHSTGPAAEPRFVDPFERIGAPHLSEPVLHVITLPKAALNLICS